MTVADVSKAGASDDGDEADQRIELGRAIRQLGHAVIGHTADRTLLAEATATLNALTERFAEGASRGRDRTRFGNQWGPEMPQGRPVYSYDDRPISGRASPWGLDLEVHRHGDEIEALVTLDSAHEGAPSRSHGGIVAALFDDVFGFVLGIIHDPAFTGELKVRYERPTPLHRPLACRCRLRERVGRKLWIEGELVDVTSPDQPVVARAEGLFITVDLKAMGIETAQRPAPPDEG